MWYSSHLVPIFSGTITNRGLIYTCSWMNTVGTIWWVKATMNWDCDQKVVTLNLRVNRSWPAPQASWIVLPTALCAWDMCSLPPLSVCACVWENVCFIAWIVWKRKKKIISTIVKKYSKFWRRKIQKVTRKVQKVVVWVRKEKSY